MNLAPPLSVTTRPYSVTLSRRAQTRRFVKAHALLLPHQVLSEVCGTARVPSAVRERLLVTFMTQQQELEQEMKQKQDKLERQQDKLDQQQDMLEREIRERSQCQLAAKVAEHLVHSRTTELIELKSCINLRGILEGIENDAKTSGAPDQSRSALWKWIFEKKPDMKSCIQTATSWDEQTILGTIESLYDTFDKHLGKTPAEWTAIGGLEIEEAAKISILDCRLLKCICKSYGIQAEVIPQAEL